MEIDNFTGLCKKFYRLLKAAPEIWYGSHILILEKYALTSIRSKRLLSTVMIMLMAL